MAGHGFALLLLPSDILSYLAREHLPPASAVALSLTCKDMFSLLFPLLTASGRPPINHPRTKAELCELLEKDTSHKYYFCPVCSSLHSYSPSEGPAASDFGLTRDGPDCHRCRWSLGRHRFTMGLHHARLAMNRHLFGAPSGISLEQFNVQYVTATSPAFTERWSAKIIDGDLFLSSTRTTIWDPADSYVMLLDSLRLQNYMVCEHTLLYLVPALRPRHSGKPIIAPCRDELGQCRRCFTDWTITAELVSINPGEEGGGTGEEEWRLTIVTFHRFLTNRGSSSAWLGNNDRFQYATEVIPLYRKAGLVRDVWLGRDAGTAEGLH